jgi:ferredoxin
MTVRVGASCTACGACLLTCPAGALSPAPRRPTVDAPRCTDCLACIEVCPVDAISLVGAYRVPIPAVADARMSA